MRRTRAPHVFVAVGLALLAAAAGAVVRGQSSHAAPSGLIVFASDRDKVNPGEIYSLAAGTAPRDVSRSPAADYGLAVAPAGDLIAFWSGRTGSDRLYLARPDGSHLRVVRAAGAGLVSRSAGSGGPLQFSADGSRLYAQVYGAPGAFLVDTRRAAARALPRAVCNGIAAPSPDLTLIACGKGGTTTVSDIVSGRARFTIHGIGPLWSSRGWLTSATPDGASGQTGSAVVADAAGVTRAVIPGTPVAWSPDGRSLAFRHDQALWIAGPGELRDAHSILGAWAGGLVSFTADSRFISATGGQGAQLISLADGHRVRDIDGGSGVWSRSGRLAYVDFAAVAAAGTPAGAKVAVMVTDTHGRNPQPVGAFPYDDHGYADLHWLPDGRRVLFVTSSECGGGGLYTVPASGGPARALTHDPRDLEAPAWSPDGTRIAVAVQKFSCHMGAGGPIHLATIAADGSDPRRVTDDDDFDSSPSFSPDGARIAFVHGSFTDASLQTVPAAGGERTQLIPPAGVTPMNAAWSPDGSRIAYAIGRSIKAVPAIGGSPEVIAADLPAIACGNGGIAWSPDGKRLAFGAGAGIYLMSVGDPASARLAVAVKCAGDPAFSPDGTRIAFDAAPVDPLGQQTAIMVADADGSGVRTLSTAPFRWSVRPAWQPA